jgi:hypothetical protein
MSNRSLSKSSSTGRKAMLLPPSHSPSTSPRSLKSFDFKADEGKTLGNTATGLKSQSISKEIEDFSCLGDRNSRKTDTEASEGGLDLEIGGKAKKYRIVTTGSEDEGKKHMENLGINECALVEKSDGPEYARFLEFMLGYEQTRSEIIIQKSKFPKMRMKEVEKALTDEYQHKLPVSPKTPKQLDPTFPQKAEKELTDLFTKLKSNALTNSNIPADLNILLDVDSPTKSAESISLSDQSKLDSFSRLSNSIKNVSRIPALTSPRSARSTSLSRYADEETSQLYKALDSSKCRNQELEEKLKKALEKIEKLEKDEESDDSLDLKSNLADMMEIQKLRDQLRLAAFKQNEANGQHQKEVEGLKGQISKVKAENFSLEERNKVLNKKVAELMQEKNTLQEEMGKVMGLQKFNAKNRNNAGLCVSCTVKVAVFPGRSMKNEMETVAENVRICGLFPELHADSWQLVKKSADLLCQLKQQSGFDPSIFIDRIRRFAESYCKTSSENSETDTFLINKQLEIYKTKLHDKKTQLTLHKQQISFLKKSVKDLQLEIAKANPLDTECIKGMFGNIIKDVPLLATNTEQVVAVLMKILNFAPEEIAKIGSERRTRRNSATFKTIFN